MAVGTGAGTGAETVAVVPAAVTPDAVAGDTGEPTPENTIDASRTVTAPIITVRRHVLPRRDPGTETTDSNRATTPITFRLGRK